MVYVCLIVFLLGIILLRRIRFIQMPTIKGERKYVGALFQKSLSPHFWIQKRILRFLHGSRIHKTHTPNVFSMQQWYTIVTVHDRLLAPSSSPWGSRKMVGLCANFTQKKLTKKYYSANELTFLQLNNLGTKNTLASYLFVNKQACFYQLFLSIADFFSCGEF